MTRRQPMLGGWSVPVIDPESVVFLTGAGISADAPTHGPIGLELTRRALDYAFLSETLDEVREVYARVLPNGSRELPRLEAVLEIAAQVHGVDVLEQLLADLVDATPNALHRFFREHLQRGGRHVTANFDSLIELGSADVKPLHFHGALDGSPQQFERLGARLSLLERGFDPAMRDRLRSALLGTPNPTLVFVGYSGLDFFDVDPFLAGVSGDFAKAGGAVVWMTHDHLAARGRLVALGEHEDAPPALRLLRAAGVPTVEVRGLTRSLLDAFARQWGISPLRARPSNARRLSLRPLPITARAEASRRLYLHMGLYLSHERLVGRHPLLSRNAGPAVQAEIAWQQGRYRRALHHWRASYAGADAATKSRRVERQAAVLWVRGSYLRAYLTSRRAVRFAVASRNEDAVAAALETQARILIHAGRTPDLRWFSTPSRRDRLATRIRTLSAGRRFGTHLEVRLRDVLALLARDPERVGAKTDGADAPDGSEVFNQYESLSSALDYRRGRKRARVAEGKETMSREWLEDFENAAELLGKTAAIKSLPTLPGATEYYTAPRALWLLATAPATVWHRMRLVVRYLLARLDQQER